ncbi:glycosyltransferase family 9 protein [uncultured Caulobacter sp.]|uniref:glycosyltransferase family 9 protein n=1 Tax=uncultured Caulobacter sp. TaxID=158749 RepID=UPI00262DC04E|nr:glycosyltransferase family 9 protein [uncultured Caulobacter sp.]
MVQTVLIYSMGEVIGDGLIKLPFIAGLRAAFPDARITWCAAKGDTVYTGPLKSVVAGYVDEVILDRGNGAAAVDSLPWRKPFGGRRFDLVIDTQENLRRSGVARRGAKGRFVSAARQARTRDWPVAVTDRLARLLALATDGQGAPKPLTLTHPDALKAAEALLPSGPTYIGLAPGAGGQDKRWPLENYLALARRVTARGWTPVFLFGPDEAEDAAIAAHEVREGLQPERNRVDAFQGVKGPLLVIALAGRLAAAVANDAGPGHMLAAGGAPLLSLQQDRRKALKFRPAADRLEMLIAEDYGDGMGALPIDAAWAALEKLVSGAA